VCPFGSKGSIVDEDVQRPELVVEQDQAAIVEEEYGQSPPYYCLREPRFEGAVPAEEQQHITVARTP
jgi:hypothetical protein